MDTSAAYLSTVYVQQIIIIIKKKQSSWIEYYSPQTLKIYVLIIVIIITG